DAEVEDLDPVALQYPDVSRFQITVDERSQRLAVDRRLEAMRRLEKLAQLDGHAGRAAGLERSARDEVREVLALQILHSDVEVTAAVAVCEEFRDVAARRAEPFLQRCAPLLGVENLACLAVGALRHELERHPLAASRVRGQEHGRRPAA